MALTKSVKPLHELLLEQGVVTAEQLKTAQAESAKTGRPLKRVLIQQGLVAEQDLAALIAGQAGVMSIDLGNYLIKPEVVALVPEALARKHVMIPVFKIGESLTVAMEDPLNFFAVDELRLKTKCEIKTVVASERSIRQAIDQYYGAAGTVSDVAQAIREAAVPQQEEDAANGPSTQATSSAKGPSLGVVPSERSESRNEAPIIKLVNLLILQAMKEQASDIHIEPGEGTLRTRFRIDGILREVNGPPAHLHSAVTSRIKVLAKLDIAEKRKPQDGRFGLTMEGKAIDLRVSTVPTQFGEKVVLRLLDGARAFIALEQLGLSEPIRVQVERLIRLPHGIFLVTGPTGSGKTTTLYAALNLINSTERNIITIEDPIEYRLPGVNQVQVNPKADVSFASALRSFLRQDPDVIMVGEIRDHETAEIAIQAALTGHLVLSTLHTNDAPSSLTRLIDMGVEPFLIASSVVGVVAQRLVRTICPKCKAAARPDASLRKEFTLPEDAQVFRGKGCPACGTSGYKGRVAILEVLPMTEAIKERVVARAPAHTIRETGRQAGMRTLREDGLAKVLAGVTTLEETLRVTQLE